MRNKHRQKEYFKTWRNKNFTRLQELERIKQWKKQGISLTIYQYDYLLREQDEKCAICFKSASLFKNRLAVDHDHKTGQIRSLLCNRCNYDVGVLENELKVTAIKKYLQKSLDKISNFCYPKV